MKIAALSLAYNEADIIGACVKNWDGLIDKHLVLVSAKPWNGSPQEDDGTARIANRLGAEVVVGYWDNEHLQRNWGLARLYDYDYVIIVDPDELYTRESQEKLLKRLHDPYDYVNRVMQPLPAFRSERMITYWKTDEYVFDPPDGHKPFIAVDPKKVQFHNKRELRGITSQPTSIQYAEPIEGVTIHHFSWVKSDEKVRQKISQYSHANDIPSTWFNDVWMAWKPEMKNIRPYGKEESSAVFSPAPGEIRKLIIDSKT